MRETTRTREARTKAMLHQCAWCSRWKTKPEMRNLGSSRGKTPTTCYDCRASNPRESWCDAHGQPHPIEHFTGHGAGRPGVRNVCTPALSEAASAARQMPDRQCASCTLTAPSWQFRGGNSKSPVCRGCEEANPGLRWCAGCSKWLLARQNFHRTGAGGAFWTRYCHPCRAAHNHGTSVAAVLARQGALVPECAACGALDRLQIDHDHRCCPGTKSCGRCVRGYLCHPCNTSEGLLRTPGRARALAAYMERHGVT